MKGSNTAAITKGQATLGNLILESNPGDTDVEFLIKSSEIDYTMVQYLEPVEYADLVIKASFRWCHPGEIQINTVCSACTAGTFSVIWNATECEDCPNKASCEGESISLNSGYWRIDANSTTIVECPNPDACLGGFFPDNTHPVACETGYQGILCNDCITDGETKYERISENTCSKCPDYTMNLIRIILVGIIFLVFLGILIK